MVKVMYNDQLVYKVVIWAFFGISLWKEKVALKYFAIVKCNNKEHSQSVKESVQFIIIPQMYEINQAKCLWTDKRNWWLPYYGWSEDPRKSHVKSNGWHVFH